MPSVDTPGPDTDSAITAVLLQITQHAERLASLDQREADRFQQISAQLAELADQLAETRDRVCAAEVSASRQAAVLAALEGLDRHVADLARRLTEIVGGRESEGYEPLPSPRWWALEGDARQESLARLRAWVDQIYRPGYGHLAAALGNCWAEHPLCLYGLDWLMELWSTLYLTDERKAATLASQAEWQSRLLPALAAQLHAETSNCRHARPSGDFRQPPAIELGRQQGVRTAGRSPSTAERDRRSR